MRYQIHPFAIMLFFLLVSGCLKKTGTLSDFTSDGCSLFPNQSLIDNSNWCECCLEHDIAYWQGGTREQRLEADRKLRDCVLSKTGNKMLANVMYRGVRFGGSPYFYNWYRWGYGWSYERKYLALTLDEQRMVSDRLFKYFEQKGATESPCD